MKKKYRSVVIFRKSTFWKRYFEISKLMSAKKKNLGGSIFSPVHQPASTFVDIESTSTKKSPQIETFSTPSEIKKANHLP